MKRLLCTVLVAVFLFGFAMIPSLAVEQQAEAPYVVETITITNDDGCASWRLTINVESPSGANGTWYFQPGTANYRVIAQPLPSGEYIWSGKYVQTTNTYNTSKTLHTAKFEYEYMWPSFPALTFTITGSEMYFSAN